MSFGHIRASHRPVSNGMEIDVASQTVIMIIVLWLSLQLPLGLVTAQVLARASRRN